MKYNKILKINTKQKYNVYSTSNINKIKKGLMDIEDIPDDWGILFCYDTSQYWGIWMKNTLIPLDIIWIDKYKTIVDKKTLLPKTENINYPKYKSKYVLEVKPGNFKGKIGDSISLEDSL